MRRFWASPPSASCARWEPMWSSRIPVQFIGTGLTLRTTLTVSRGAHAAEELLRRRPEVCESEHRSRSPDLESPEWLRQAMSATGVRCGRCDGAANDDVCHRRPLPRLNRSVLDRAVAARQASEQSKLFQEANPRVFWRCVLSSCATTAGFCRMSEPRKPASAGGAPRARPSRRERRCNRAHPPSALGSTRSRACRLDASACAPRTRGPESMWNSQRRGANPTGGLPNRRDPKRPTALWWWTPGLRLDCGSPSFSVATSDGTQKPALARGGLVRPLISLAFLFAL